MFRRFRILFQGESTDDLADLLKKGEEQVSLITLITVSRGREMTGC